ncbi:MAG: hypothetical protein WCH75_00655 [Candidatus Binatia bacterium]
MSSINEIKQSVDVKLDKLDARADALQAALAGSKDQTNERIARRKQEARQAIDNLSSEIGQQKDLPDERKRAIRSLVDDLNEQLASSQTAAHETLAYTRKQIQENLRKMETEVDAAFDKSGATDIEPLQVSIGAFARASDKLDAELEAAELCFSSVRDKVGAVFDQGRKKTAQDIAALKQRLGERNTITGGQLAGFESGLREEFEQVAKTFKASFS